MSTDFLAFLALALLAVVAIVIAEWGRAHDLIKEGTSRRFVHVTVGLFVAIAVIALDSPVWLFVAAACAFLINVVSLQRGWLQSIHGSHTRSLGTVTFPLGILLILPFFWNSSLIARYPLALGFAVLAVSDPVAAIVGSRFEENRFLSMGPEGKTLAGATAFGLTAWLITGLWITLVESAGRLPFDAHWVWHMAAMVGIVATAAEMVGRKGWDNVLIVVAVVLVLLATESGERARFLGWCVVVSIAFSLLAYRLRFLDAGGAAVTGLMGGAFLYFGGWAWVVPPVIFFFSSSLLSVWSARRQGATQLHQVRGSRRDGVQALANGGVGCLIVIAAHFTPFAGAYWTFAGAFAAAAADTFATEIGTALRGRTWSIISGVRTEPGTSGGVSLAGFGASLAGGALVGISAAAALGTFRLAPIVVVTVAGFAAGVVDSLLGATVQVRYRTRAGVITDASSTDDLPNERAGGWRCVNNDTVNFLCTAAGAAAAAGMMSVL